jgi:hypothetical protein
MHSPIARRRELNNPTQFSFSVFHNTDSIADWRSLNNNKKHSLFINVSLYSNVSEPARFVFRIPSCLLIGRYINQQIQVVSRSRKMNGKQAKTKIIPLSTIEEFENSADLWYLRPTIPTRSFLRSSLGAVRPESNGRRKSPTELDRSPVAGRRSAAESLPAAEAGLALPISRSRRALSRGSGRRAVRSPPSRASWCPSPTPPADDEGPPSEAASAGACRAPTALFCRGNCRQANSR